MRRDARKRPLRPPRLFLGLPLLVVLTLMGCDGSRVRDAGATDGPPATAETGGEAAAPREGSGQAASWEADLDGGEWRRADPADEGLDPVRLARGVERLGRLRGARSLLVVRNGRVVADESFAGSGLNRRPHDVKSASKSLLSALVGIALERDDLPGLEVPVAELLPTYGRGLAGAKRRITLAHLLSMSTGLASTSGEHYGAWVAAGDWTAAALDRPLAAAPGEEFIYSTGNTHLLSAVLTEATGRSTLEFAREVLFEPIGIEVASWQRSPEGFYFGGNNLRMSPRDLARFGQLFLQQGRWDGRQVVPADWVERSTRRHAVGWPDRYGAYGYLWWLPDDPWGSFAAIGYGGQFLYVVPELRMLAVMTSTVASKGAAWDRQAFEIFRDDVFGAAL